MGLCSPASRDFLDSWMTHFLGIDLGTSAVKAVVVDETQVVRAEATQAITTTRPSEGWGEQDPQDWWRVVGQVVDRLKAQSAAALADVRAIGLSGQMHAAVLLGKDGVVLRPAIIWSDVRSQAQCQQLAEAHPELIDTAGVIPMPGFTAPKLMWLSEHEPATYDRIATVLQPKDYLRFRMTGEFVSDMSEAAGTWWLDQARRSWSLPALAATRSRREWMPRLVEGSVPSAVLRADVARSWGLVGNVCVAGGAGDVAAAAIGLGAIADGAALISLGTSAQLFVSTAAYRPAAPNLLIHAFCHALPHRWFQMAAMLNGASCLAWAAQLLGCDVGDLIERTTARYHRPGALLFLPYLGGERTPHNNPLARGVIFGATVDTDAIALAQAVMEGVACSIADAHAALASSGTRIAGAAFVGGGAQSKLWARMLASLLNIPLTRHVGADKGPAFGAARLARMALTGESPEAVAGPPEIHDVTEPDPTMVPLYQEQLLRFRALYRAVVDEFRRPSVTDLGTAAPSQH
jgi:xylulokinase